MKFREIRKSDVDDILKISVSTKENYFSMEDLAEVGDTDQAVLKWLDGSIKGCFVMFQNNGGF